MTGTIRKAIVLAAGLGMRMRPITDKIPKPLVKIAGKELIDWGLDALAQADVETAVVNVHYLPDLLIRHLQSRGRPGIRISDERNRLLDSGGGVVHALRHLGDGPFFVLNADTFWIDRAESNLRRLADAWDDRAMDILLMLCPFESATGHTGGADFLRDGDGRLVRARGADSGLIYAGAAVMHPRVFDDAPPGPHSLNVQFDKAIASGRLHGMVLEGDWITVGTPGAIAPAEAAVARAARGR